MVRLYPDSSHSSPVLPRDSGLRSVPCVLSIAELDGAVGKLHCKRVTNNQIVAAAIACLEQLRFLVVQDRSHFLTAGPAFTFA